LHAASDAIRQDAIAREKQLKNWRRDKKIALIDAANPEWLYLSGEVTRYPSSRPKRRRRVVEGPFLYC
jgi:hypothetical protein